MDKSEHLNLYREMVVIRRLEERAAELYQQGKIGGFRTCISARGCKYGVNRGKAASG